jgi:hypothetical protein
MMATQASKTEAKKTTQAAKRTTQSAKRTGRSTQHTGRQAERTVRAFVTDGAYAALGVGDSAVEVLRGVPGRVERLRKGAPRTVETRVKDVEQRVKSLWAETPEELKARVEGMRRSAGKEFDTYARRGRSVVRSVTSNKAAQRAAEQTKVARTQVKAATTSVRKALGQSVEAAETAADRIGDEQRA